MLAASGAELAVGDIASAIWMASGTGIGRTSFITWLSVFPSRYSITMNALPSCSSISWMVQMFG